MDELEVTIKTCDREAIIESLATLIGFARDIKNCPAALEAKTAIDALFTNHHSYMEIAAALDADDRQAFSSHSKEPLRDSPRRFLANALKTQRSRMKCIDCGSPVKGIDGSTLVRHSHWWPVVQTIAAWC